MSKRDSAILVALAAIAGASLLNVAVGAPRAVAEWSDGSRFSVAAWAVGSALAISAAALFLHATYAGLMARPIPKSELIFGSWLLIPLVAVPWHSSAFPLALGVSLRTPTARIGVNLFGALLLMLVSRAFSPPPLGGGAGRPPRERAGAV